MLIMVQSTKQSTTVTVPGSAHKEADYACIRGHLIAIADT